MKIVLEDKEFKTILNNMIKIVKRDGSSIDYAKEILDILTGKRNGF